MNRLLIDDHHIAKATLAELAKQVNKAREILASQQEEVKWNAEEFIFIRDANVVRRLRIEDILFAEAMGDYVKIYTEEKLYAIHSKLKTVEERLPWGKFLRIHRSYIVAINKIDFLQDSSLNIGGKFLPVSDAYRRILSQRMNIL